MWSNMLPKQGSLKKKNLENMCIYCICVYYIYIYDYDYIYILSI